MNNANEVNNNVIHIDHFRPEYNREITVCGVPWEVQMTGPLWEALELLKDYEGISENELAMYALEEMELQTTDFDTAFRGVVAYLINRWKD